MAVKHLRALFAGDERRDLWREEARKLLALPLDRLEQVDVGDGDRGLVGERAHELDLVVAERPLLGTTERQDPQNSVVADQRHREERPHRAAKRERGTAARRTPVVLGDVGDLYRPLFEVRSPDDSVWPDRHRTV